MQRLKLYLEAPARTQDLLTMKWTLLSKGYTIASTWHEDPWAGFQTFDGHWSSQRLAEIQQSDALVVLAGQANDNLSLGAVAGIALGRQMGVIWIGQPIEVLSRQASVQHFRTPAEFYRQELTSPEWLFGRFSLSRAA